MDGIFGLIANGISVFLTHPIDVIKTNYQLNQTRSNDISGANVFRSVMNARGIRGFYTGLIPNLFTNPIFWSVYFSSRQMMGDRKISENKHADRFVKSYAAGIIGSCLTNPLFVLKIRMQSNSGETKTVRDAIRGTNQLGMRSYFRGLGSTCLTNFKIAIQFPMYDVLKDKTESVIISSLGSKVISSSILYPLDLIRVNQRNSNVMISTADIARTIYRKNGIKGLYRGLFLYNAVSTPNFIIMMIGVESLRNIFGYE